MLKRSLTRDLKGAAVARNRKIPPKLVEWAQERILQKLLQFLAQGAQFSHSTTSPNVDAKAVATRGVRDAEFLEALTNINENLRELISHLEIQNEIKLGR